MSVQHPEHDLEQAYVTRAYNLLDRGLADAERSMAEYRAPDRATARAIQRALRILQDSRGSGQLVFGKMRCNGEELYIGRRRVRNEDYEPLVIGWHAPAAEKFYTASPAAPQDLDLKRVFVEEDRNLVRVFDEIVAAAAAAATDTTGAGTAFSDALLDELERSRDGAMRDVVATIQSEQYAIIRAPQDRAVVVQGGPGTGKTVVGLHRAAWLAFNSEELRRTGILVVAPSSTFLTYVSGVLPSLDVTDVDQTEIQRLYAGEAEASATDDLETERVKGSVAMAEVLRRALQQRIGWGDETLVLGLGPDQIHLPAERIHAMLDDVRGRNLPHIDGRELVREMLSRMAFEQHRRDQQEAGRPARANQATIRRLSVFVNAVDRIWPAFTPEEFLRSLYGTQAWLVRASEGVLTADERARLYRAPAASVRDEPWTAADLFCLDEVSALLARDLVTYGHLVVDEAQDLSPMQARALARRCPSGSFTILGDLAQCTGVWTRDSWSELTPHLTGGPVDEHKLSIGYRVPAEVLELAAEQLPLAGVALEAPRSIRRGGGAPAILRTTPADLSDVLRAEATDAVERGRSTAILVADETYDHWWSTLADALDLGDGRDGDFSHRATLVPAAACKGLEFDAIFLVEPADIAESALHPARSLYVAMTRCTQTLSLIHTRDLPPGLSPEADVPVETSQAGDQCPDEGGSVGPLAEPASPAVEDHVGDLLSLLEDLSPQDLALVTNLVKRLLMKEES